MPSRRPNAAVEISVGKSKIFEKTVDKTLCGGI